LLLALVLIATSAGPAAAAAPAELQQTWHATQADVPDARGPGHDGAGVIVAVLDTWVDRTHPDFEGRVLVGADCVGGTCRSGERSDGCDHGTHVAGTVASTSFGVAPGATVLPVQVLSFDPATGECTGDPVDVAAGMRWAVDHGAQVLNLSLGADVPGLSEGPLPAAVAEAVAKGRLVVFSAGNSDLPVPERYGGQALLVAATGPDGQLASYSQRGAGISLAAPGGDAGPTGACTEDTCVTSLFPRGRYAVAAGTSMAAPVVSGTAALLLAQDPTRTAAQVRALLQDTARPLAGAGAGLLDAAAALGARGPVVARGTASPVPSAEPVAAAPPAGDDTLPGGPELVAIGLLLAASLGLIVEGRLSRSSAARR
jgi:subtilisin family serine protease